MPEIAVFELPDEGPAGGHQAAVLSKPKMTRQFPSTPIRAPYRWKVPLSQGERAQIAPRN
jgi:hypothetical protein